MNNNEWPARDWDHALERLADHVAVTAYAVALHHGTVGSWVEWHFLKS